MTRFLHTADWQLGMRRHYLHAEAEPRFRQARIDVLKTIARVAREQDCAFAVVCGDAFESNQVDRRTLGRTLDLLDAFPCPVYLLPGNHDPLDAASLYRSPILAAHPRAMVLDGPGPWPAAEGVEIVAAPWLSKRPRQDLVAAMVGSLAPAPSGTLRIGVAHGMVDELAPRERPETIARAPADAALADGRLHYLALGDRHSVTEVAPRIWYSGAPEATDFRETEPGHVLVVDLDAACCRVTPHRTGVWRFLEERRALHDAGDVDALAGALRALPDKGTTVLRLLLTGALRVGDKGALDALIADLAELFAGVQDRSEELLVLAGDEDAAELGLTGFARATVERLAARSATDVKARDALSLLHRLARHGEAP